MKFEEVVGLSVKDLVAASQGITERYRAGGSLSTEEQKKAYLLVRMPATSAVLRRVLQEIKESIETALDLGAVPGTAIEPLLDRFPTLKKITMMERDKTFIAMGKNLFLNEKVTWLERDIAREQTFDPHDLLLPRRCGPAGNGEVLR